MATRQHCAQPVAYLRLITLERTRQPQIQAEMPVVDGTYLGAQPAEARVELRFAVPRHAPDHACTAGSLKVYEAHIAVNARAAPQVRARAASAHDSTYDSTPSHTPGAEPLSSRDSIARHTGDVARGARCQAALRFRCRSYPRSRRRSER